MKNTVALILAIFMLLGAFGISSSADDVFMQSEDMIVKNTTKNMGIAYTQGVGGLDDIVGITANTTVTIPVLEDTYVEGGNSQNINFGSAEMMDFKALAIENPDNPTQWESMHRVPSH